MPLKRAGVLVHIDRDFNIVFPMRDRKSKKLVECLIPMQAMSDIYDAPPGEEIETFCRHRTAIEAAASAAYDGRHAQEAGLDAAVPCRDYSRPGAPVMARAGGVPARAGRPAEVAAAILCI